MKSINKIMTLILLVVWLLLMWRTFWALPAKEETGLPVELDREDVSAPKEESEGVDDTASYASILKQLKTPFDISRYQELFTRNIFVKPEKTTEFTPENLKLLSVERVTLPFMYKGYIQTANAGIIGQVNWGEKTYFIKKGEKFKDYKVIEIQRALLTVEGNEGQLILQLGKPVKGKEFLIKLYNELDGKIYELRKGDEISGYKILDITSDSVVIWGKNKEWVIKKGR